MAKEVIKVFPEEMTKRTQYRMLEGTDSQKMSTAVDSVLNVKAWMLHKDEDTEVLTVETEDGELFATISTIFIKQFKGIVEFFGEDVGEIKVDSATSRAGRTYLTCSVF